MSDKGDIFSQPNPAETPPTAPSNPDPFVDLLTQIKNEQGEPKYKTIEEALKALQHSQQFIKTLQTEKQDVETQLLTARTELSKLGDVESFVNRLLPTAAPQNPQPTSPGTQGLSEAEITRLLETALNQRDEQTRATSNLQTVVNELKKVHGDNASTVIAQRAKELNTTVDNLKDLARTNPAMALSLLSVQSKSSPKPSLSTTNPSFKPSEETGLKSYEHSAARGGLTNKELVNRWREAGELTFKKLNVET